MNQNVRLQLTCPNCGNSIWIKMDEGFECSACGEISNTEDMCCEGVPELRHIIVNNEIVMIFAKDNSKNFTKLYDGNDYISFYTFDNSADFMQMLKRKVDKPDSKWFWVFHDGKLICSGGCDTYSAAEIRMYFNFYKRKE